MKKYIRVNPLTLKRGDIVRVNNASTWKVRGVNGHSVIADSLRYSDKGPESLSLKNIFEKEK